MRLTKYDSVTTNMYNNVYIKARKNEAKWHFTSTTSGFCDVNEICALLGF
jgi:hypothetical protein